ncbi:hypothetical protein G6F52_014072 [Rhizopus delemar]|nr:hypothetical protein G6F52_014072 [Rhizopus delemar]
MSRAWSARCACRVTRPATASCSPAAWRRFRWRSHQRRAHRRHAGNRRPLRGRAGQLLAGAGRTAGHAPAGVPTEGLLADAADPRSGDGADLAPP